MAKQPPLTETVINVAVRTAKETKKRQELRDPGHPGLWLRIGVSGTRTWVLRAREPGGKPHWFELGRHPEMGLAQARRAADATLVKVRAGANPIAEQREARKARAAASASVEPADTLAAILALYEAQRCSDLKSWPRSRRRIAQVFAPLLSRSLGTLASREFQIVADNYPAKHNASLAVRALRPALRWAAKRDYCSKALAEIEPPVATRQRRRVLSVDELARVCPVLDEGPQPYGACMRLILLTACRLSEAVDARWRDVDWQAGTWMIPTTKSDREHIVPLSRQAIALLRRRLPADARPEARIFATSSGGTLSSNWDRATKRIMVLSETSGWHRHDLRRTSATLMGELGTDPHVIEAALGHVTIHSGLASVYNRARYRPQVAAALQRLADLLDAIEQGRGAQVVPLTAALA